MKKNNALRKRLEILLPNDYRQVIVDRLKDRGIKVHPNTVGNVLNGSNNTEVALEILKLGIYKGPYKNRHSS
ncbi:MAG: hypothetical protein C0490_18185 [Marivirga sp.]|nr:hypothetical protein [Marivirga sp.]